MICAAILTALGLVLLHNTAESVALAAIEAMRACRRARRDNIRPEDFGA